MRLTTLISGACLTASAAATAALSQAQTNGLSLLGTLDAPELPQFLTSNPLPDGFPWGTKKADNANPYKEAPITGVTRYYKWTLARSQLAPDGYQKDMILINGQFPGPRIEANWGDWIQGRPLRNSESEDLLADLESSGGDEQHHWSIRRHLNPLAWPAADCYTLV